MINKNKLISFFIPNLYGGGAEKVVINLVKGFISKGYNVDIVVLNFEGQLVNSIPKECRVIELKSKRVLFSILKLIKYLKTNKPFIFISNLEHANIISLLASFFVRNIKFYLIVHINPIKSSQYGSKLKEKLIPILIFILYWKADKIIAVSDGVREDLEKIAPYLKGRIEVIYNPVIYDDIFVKAEEPVDHPWFYNKDLVKIISIGRLEKQKDHLTLIKAFYIVKQKYDNLRLIILGEGSEREKLENLIKKLNIENFVWMPGFVVNPYKYLKRSDIFVLSSIYEGFAIVLVEALAFGLQVISTDCESGPKEILDNGKYGILVKIGDYIGIANAIEDIVTGKKKFYIPEEILNIFTLDFNVNRYLELIENERNL